MILTYRELRYAVPQFSVGTYMYPLVGADQAPKAADAVVVSKSRLRNGRGVSAEHFVFSSSPCLSLTIRGGRVINSHLLRHDTLGC